MVSKEAGTYQVDTPLPKEIGSITAARGIARRVLTECGYQGHHEDVLLVVSELVTNALVHGDGPPSLRMRGSASKVRIEVSDEGERLPEPREPGPANGWGLHVVRLLSTGWGISPRDGGKVVWCELAARLAPLQAAPRES
ncbi:ATP-binding protein [Nonomuraea phyllanthi]|uniref:ATP-binding protein n=1 Tax=Nonomuraea phyllanthi TaxID=2219224 RepID=UPI0012930C0E|nr:ATP-binding protein [Nonomuraea phyllanthi]QFY08841.1 ATP-binding protein [Nonomuraea phyllanthi]